MGVKSLPVTQQRRGCDLNPGLYRSVTEPPCGQSATSILNATLFIIRSVYRFKWIVIVSFVRFHDCQLVFFICMLYCLFYFLYCCYNDCS